MQTTITTLFQKSDKDIEVVNKVAFPNIDASVCKSFDRLLAQKKSTPSLFFELVNKFGKWFSISNAILSIYNNHTGILTVVSWWDLKTLKQGVLISLPTENSLFYKVVKSGQFISEQANEKFSGNYIEKRLITSNNTSAIISYPLILDGTTYGVISFSSPVPYAFDMLEQGYFSKVFEKVASKIAESEEEIYKFECHDNTLVKRLDNLTIIEKNKVNRLKSMKIGCSI